ncbi:MAG: hypothetical protein KatS3mg011_0903 [Acidimicrobiia bacterium]|nr:MAG: hypothetical protein KatS3mg011_0903 [Acidimicrobiia bacterium]
MTDDTDIRPAVEFALLADSVQVVQGKLYVLGGGWDTLFVPDFPARHPALGIGLRVRVPWSWTDRVLVIGVDLQDEDGNRVLPSPPLAQGVKVKRPVGIPEGSDIGVARSFTFYNLTFPREGAYSFVVTLDGEVATRLRFSVRRRRP